MASRRRRRLGKRKAKKGPARAAPVVAAPQEPPPGADDGGLSFLYAMESPKTKAGVTSTESEGAAGKKSAPELPKPAQPPAAASAKPSDAGPKAAAPSRASKPKAPSKKLSMRAGLQLVVAEETKKGNIEDELDDTMFDYYLNAVKDAVEGKPDLWASLKQVQEILAPMLADKPEDVAARLALLVCGSRQDAAGGFQVFSLATLMPRLKQTVRIADIEIYKISEKERRQMWGTDKVNAKVNSELNFKKLGLQNAKKFAIVKERMAAMLGRISTGLSSLREGGGDAEMMGGVLADIIGTSKAKDIIVPTFDLLFAGKVMLVDAALRLSSKRRYGLIGKNGIGKSTLLNHIAAGAIEGMPGGIKICHVHQEAAADSRSCIEAVMDSDIELAALKAKLKELEPRAEAGDSEAEEELFVVMKALDAIGIGEARARASKILWGLQFTGKMANSPTSGLSGGWRMRVSLASALFVEPELLLLDEPTNHLDLQACLWLEHYLGYESDSTVVIVSHDRAFLNNVTTDIIHFTDQQSLDYYRGDYETFEKEKEARRKDQQRQFEAVERRRAHMQAFVDKFRFNAKRASLVQSRIKAIKKLDSVAAVVDEAEFRFEFPVPDANIGTPILQISNAAFSYSGKVQDYLFRGVNMNVDLKSRIGLLGVNGAGKSTLLNIMLGHLKESEGSVYRNGRLRVGYFTQHHLELLDAGSSSSPLNVLQRLFPGRNEVEYRRHLGAFGVSGSLGLQAIGTLSGGQKSRVAFAVMTWNRPHILVLDEPTNHLDLETIAALSNAIRKFQGGLVCVSHDQHFIQEVCKELWVMGDKMVRKFDGDFKKYKKHAAADYAASKVGRRRRR